MMERKNFAESPVPNVVLPYRLRNDLSREQNKEFQYGLIWFKKVVRMISHTI